jgi:hypothetical protein
MRGFDTLLAGEEGFAFWVKRKIDAIDGRRGDARGRARADDGGWSITRVSARAADHGAALTVSDRLVVISGQCTRRRR